MAKVIFVIACLIAFLAPFILSERGSVVTNSAVENFPDEFEGRELRDLGLSEREQFFLNDFPGQIGRFTDGYREIIIRRVTESTRKLHPASDCFEAVGYSTTPLPIRVDENNKRWACFVATRNDDRLRICERIYDHQGNDWTDVSSWYWATWGKSGEWWALTVAERESDL
ncbi:MAG: hypothetical protein AB7J13_04315 [Pyrinomonadaceae bacterium]